MREDESPSFSTVVCDKYISPAQDLKRAAKVRAITADIRRARVAAAEAAATANAGVVNSTNERNVCGYQHVWTSLPERLLVETFNEDCTTIQMELACDLAEKLITHAAATKGSHTLARGCFTIDDLRARFENIGCALQAIEDDPFCDGHKKITIYFHSPEQSETSSGRYTLSHFSEVIKKIIDERGGAGRMIPEHVEMCEFRVRTAMQLRIYLEPAYRAMASTPLTSPDLALPGPSRLYYMSHSELEETPEEDSKGAG